MAAPELMKSSHKQHEKTRGDFDRTDSSDDIEIPSFETGVSLVVYQLGLGFWVGEQVDLVITHSMM
jgi:hypothetical protein